MPASRNVAAVPRTLVLQGPRDLAVRDEPGRAPGRGEVRVRSLLSAVSHGTELALYRGSSPFGERVFDRGLRAFAPASEGERHYPAALGYETVGVVEEVGPGVTGVAAGAILHVGAPHADETVVDLAAGGAYPPVILPWNDHLERGAYVSVGAVALQAIHDAPIRLGAAVAVVGLGAVGLLALQMARLAGAAHVVALDLSPVRRELALSLGADEAHDPRLDPDGPGAAYKRSAGRGVDVALETSGSDAGLHDAIACTGLGGTVVTVGFYQGGAARLRLGEEWHHNRLTMVSSMGAWDAPHRDHPAWTRPRIMQTVVDLLGSGTVRIDQLPVRRFAFEEAPEAYAWLDRHPDDALKLILTHGR